MKILYLVEVVRGKKLDEERKLYTNYPAEHLVRICMGQYLVWFIPPGWLLLSTWQRKYTTEKKKRKEEEGEEVKEAKEVEEAEVYTEDLFLLSCFAASWRWNKKKYHIVYIFIFISMYSQSKKSLLKNTTAECDMPGIPRFNGYNLILFILLYLFFTMLCYYYLFILKLVFHS